MTTPDYTEAAAYFGVSPDRLRAGLNIRVDEMRNDYGVTDVVVGVCYKHSGAGNIGNDVWSRKIRVREVWRKNEKNQLGQLGAYTWAVSRPDIDRAISDLIRIHGDMPVKICIADRNMVDA